ncbi:MAG: ribosome silencing factor [Bacilli bacterium]|nr:ribosome silencing factor [Bacilli bacterium]
MKFKNKELEIVLKAIDKAVLKDIIVYNIQEVTPFFDYSIITTATSSRQGHAAVEYLRDAAEENNILVKGYADSSDSSWFLVDLNNIIVHVFVNEERQRFNLDGLYYNLDKEILED